LRLILGAQMLRRNRTLACHRGHDSVSAFSD